MKLIKEQNFYLVYNRLPGQLGSTIVDAVLKPALNQGSYNFASSLLSQRLGDKLLYLRNNHEFQRIPPADVIFLHRKLAGMFLLCARINARVDVRATILDYLEQGQEGHQLAAS